VATQSPSSASGAAWFDRAANLETFDSTFEAWLGRVGVQAVRGRSMTELLAPLLGDARFAPPTGDVGMTFEALVGDTWSCMVSLLPRPDGGTVAVILDVSASKHALSLYHDAEIMARTGVWELDFGSGEITFTEGTWSVFGEDARHTMQQIDNWIAAVHPDDRPRMQAAVHHSMTTGAPYDISYRFRRTDGSVMHLVAKGKMVPDPDGVPRMARGLFQDVTEIREAQAALQLSETRLQAILASSPDVISILDASGHFTFLSASVVGILGYSPGELIGTHALAQVHPKDIDSCARALERVLATHGHTENVDLRYRHRDGTWRNVEVIAHNHLADPAVAGVVLSTRDVTERNQLRLQLEQAQRMESLGRLTAGIAHDFNNILTTVQGAAELLHDDLAPEDPRLEELDQILYASGRATDLVRQLLTFSRQRIAEPVVLDINQSMRRADGLLKRTLGADVALTLRLADDLWPVVMDPTQLEQIILNLAVNARDAMPDGGWLSMETSNILIEAVPDGSTQSVPPGDYVQIAVSDSGIGMSEEIRARVFEPFFTTKEAGRGTGLGLSTVFGIVRQAGGQVRIYSEPGVGSTFKILLPRSDQTAAADAVQTDEGDPKGGHETVLVVEDAEDVRNLVQKVLGKLGYDLLLAESASAALQLAEAHPDPIDMLLTDVVMPGMNGRQLADILCTRRPGLKVLFMSGYTDRAIATHGILEAGIALLQKPFGPRKLAAKVRETLEGLAYAPNVPSA
jgi:two-component system cell cycle sensor histidine kinase/response regulator CckA